jgi:transcriptional regulator with XRE-family HTH domain
MSLGECSRAAGISTQHLSKIERGRIVPDDVTCIAIGLVLGLTLEQVRTFLPSKQDTERDAKRWSDAILALAAVHEDAKKRGLKKGNGGTSEIECPIDKGRLRYSVASVNGHIWGACSNPDCVRWME